MSDMTATFDKFAGCFLGQCLGDALGHPVEGFGSDECLDYLHSQMKPLWHGRLTHQAYPFGQYTDDSQMARELLASLTAYPAFDGDDYARRLRPLFDRGLVIGPGLACSDAMHRIMCGVSWREAGCPPPQAGNGTAMRAAPVGMMHHAQPDTLVRVAREQGWLTHRDPRCDAGSIAVAGAVALALQGHFEPRTFCNQLADWMSDAEKPFAELMRRLPEFVSQRPEDTVLWIAKAGKDFRFVEHWPGISPFVIGTVLWSVYSFLRTPDDYYASIWVSIGVGGDVDTTAAITGAISGAFNGRSALPEQLLSRLHDHGEWRLSALETLCEQAYETTTGPAARPD